VTALRANILSAVADIRAYTSEVRNSATAAQNTSTQTMTVALQQASAASRTTTAGFMHDYYDRRVFDPYLRFASTGDEEEYRRREDERRRAIEKALAEHTPAGELRAANLAIDQLHDAGAHGATRSPAYKRWEDDLCAKRDRLRSAIAGRTNEKAVQEASQAVDAAKPNVAVSPELLAGFRASGVVVADQNGTGHGITARDPAAARAATPPH